MTTWRCFVINLDRSPHRLAQISAQLNALNISFERFVAVEGLEIDPDATPLFNRRRYEKRHGKTPTPCEIGCFLSHLGVMQRFLETDAPYCLVLEDDAILDLGLPAVLAGLAGLQGEWNVALLYGNYPGLAQPLARVDRGHELVGYLARQTGAVAYAIDRKAAQTYVRELLPMTLPIDVDFDRAWDLDIRFRGVEPFPVTTGAHPSDIGRIGRKFAWYRRLGTYALRGIGELRRYRHYALTDPIWLASLSYRSRTRPAYAAPRPMAGAPLRRT